MIGDTEGFFTKPGRAVRVGDCLSMQPACPQTASVRVILAPDSQESLAGTTAAASQGLHGCVLIQVTKAPESLEIQGLGDAEDNHSTTEVKTASQN